MSGLPLTARLRGIAFRATCVCALFSVVGCVSVSARHTGASTLEDLRQEDNYKAAWGVGITAIRNDNAAVAPTATSPGACGKGGTEERCRGVQEALIKDVRALLSDLQALPVPPRYKKADALVKRGFTESTEGLELRVESLSGAHGGSFAEGNAKLAEAVKFINEGYAAFPADNRPVPSP